MAYKSILTVLSSNVQMAQLDAARQIARHEDAHLDILCLGLDLSQPGYYFPGGAPYVFQQGLEAAETEAETLRTAVNEQLANDGDLRWGVESVVAQLGGVANLVGHRARYVDLTIMSQPYGEGAAGSAETVTEAAMFEGDCPILVVPRDGLLSTRFRRVLVAWNQSNEAMTAIRRALPLLRQAERVEITVIDPTRAGFEGAEPGSGLARMLTRHGVQAEIAVLARTASSVSEQINRHALDMDADLIVMGAYGHSRFREAILGGATRNMLENATLPVFMAR
ncbi:universal stress protein [Paracoccus tegillarcae]|uniref:Universal stress protein n=1 Tax=Paracoccus tegillarcae TaxID=1529068 RepID=A0A2K9F1Q2_9RHOB|nr:universal stress protein [Paracoccus tegillarcae]AUH35494.1 universal stress protein [Paracoccus tegillarcae]